MSNRDLFDSLSSQVRFAETFIVSSLPRGGLHIVQPARILEHFLKSYTREFYLEDVATWEANARDEVVDGAGAWGDEARFEASVYHQQFMLANGLKYLAVAPIDSPVLKGYFGSWHLYRTAEQGPFSQKDLATLLAHARQWSERSGKLRSSRQSRLEVEAPWAARQGDKQIVFHHNLELRWGSAEFERLDDRLRSQLIEHTRHRLAHVNGVNHAGDRLQLPDSKGDLWTFRCVLFSRYPALGTGAFVMYCVQPSCKDWGMMRSNDFQADAELSRLMPAAQFMQEEFHRGPTLTEIARTVHLSPFHFHRRFTELLGITPKHFLLECQIYSAKSQLAAGDKELVDIASSCGFAHQSHFTSRFKQATGLTPTRWRKVTLRDAGVDSDSN